MPLYETVQDLARSKCAAHMLRRRNVRKCEIDTSYARHTRRAPSLGCIFVVSLKFRGADRKYQIGALDKPHWPLVIRWEAVLGTVYLFVRFVLVRVVRF